MGEVAMCALKNQEQITITTSVEENVKMICEALYHSSDLTKRKIQTEEYEGVILFLETMVDTQKIVDAFLVTKVEAHIDTQLTEKIASEELEIRHLLADIVTDLLQGKTIVLLEGIEDAFSFQTIQEALERAPEEPDNEKIVRGAHNGFIENIYANIHLVRKRLIDRHLHVNYFSIGQETKLQVAMLYMEGLANPSVVKKIEKKLTSLIDLKALEVMEVDELLTENRYSPFPQNAHTERPDELKKHLMKGRVAVFIDGTAAVLVLPVTFFTFFHSPD